MQISFHGAARTVTGSKHLLTLNNGRKLLLDCGMFQGMGAQTDELNRNFGFNPREIDYLILSHAHIDHSGLIPLLVKQGFNGKIFCTPATKDLAAILLEDSAVIQREDTKFSNKKRSKKGLPLLEALYDIQDATAAIKLYTEADYGNWLTIEDGIDVLFTDAGHIIGSAAVSLRIKEQGQTVHITFSGDVGRYRDVILRSPENSPQADYILLESTYGNSLHKDVHETKEGLLNWITKTCLQKRGKLIIPAFSVGRTQEILYALNQLENEHRLPQLTYFVDSPLSREATEVVKSHPENFNQELQQVLLHDKDPFNFYGLQYIKTSDESKQINFYNQPCVIISASGMADAGRVKHHIRNNISSQANTILMVGYCEPASLGARLMRGEKEVRIFGEEYDVVAEVGSIKSMSAHGDYEDLIQFISNQDKRFLKKIFLVHGEYDVQSDFAERLRSIGYTVEIPGMHAAEMLG
ncbi:MAG: MBL fold metallo-hydrolase [Segetibacter sp.]|nr:MBL fold metallo-hydrolase [Segetibacter sp.]